MPKEGMHQRVHKHSDPTYDAVLATFKREEKAARRQKKAVKPFRIFATLHTIIRRAGYKLISEIVLEDDQGNIVRHGYDHRRNE